MLIACLCGLPLTAHGKIKMPSIISEHMVLQAEVPVTIRGWGEAGETITVQFSGQQKSCTVNPDGLWQTQLDPLEPSSQGRSLIVRGHSETLTVGDVIVGQVWVCGGQSNMEYRLSQTQGATTEIAQADYPEMRWFAVMRQGDWEPSDDVEGNWRVISPSTAGKSSAVAYYFGQALYEAMGQPVGLIVSAVGGSPGEAWASRTSLLANPYLHRTHDQITQLLTEL